jgi:hypothetical protein
VVIPLKGVASAKTFCAAGKRKDTIVTLFRKQVNIYDVTNGSLLQTLTSSRNEAKLGAMSNPSGWRYYGLYMSLVFGKTGLNACA